MRTGLDKIMISPDGDITVTNDGATIMSQMQVRTIFVPRLCLGSIGRDAMLPGAGRGAWLDPN